MTEQEYIIKILETIQNNLDTEKDNEKDITDTNSSLKDLHNRDNDFNGNNGVRK